MRNTKLKIAKGGKYTYYLREDASKESSNFEIIYDSHLSWLKSLFETILYFGEACIGLRLQWCKLFDSNAFLKLC